MLNLLNYKTLTFVDTETTSLDVRKSEILSICIWNESRSGNIEKWSTKIKPKSFYFVSRLGMLLGTSLFINAGTQLSKINTINDVLNKYIIISLVLIASSNILS